MHYWLNLTDRLEHPLSVCITLIICLFAEACTQQEWERTETGIIPHTDCTRFYACSKLVWPETNKSIGFYWTLYKCSNEMFIFNEQWRGCVHKLNFSCTGMIH